MKTIENIFKWFFRIIAGLCLVWIIAAWAIIRFILPSDRVEPYIQELLDDNVDARTEFSAARFEILSTFPNISFIVKDFKAIQNSGYEPDTVFSLDRLQVSLDLSALVHNHISFRKTDLIHPYIHFQIDSLGNTNLQKIIKRKTSESERDSIKLAPVINLNDLEISGLRMRYEDMKSGKTTELENVDFAFSGTFNTRDTILTIPHGNLRMGENNIKFEGCSDISAFNLTFSHKFDNINGILSKVSDLTDVQLNDANVTGHFEGEWTVHGTYRSPDSIDVSGRSRAWDICAVSSKNETIISRGQYEIDLVHSHSCIDSSTLTVKKLSFSGDNIFCDAKCVVTYRNGDFFIEGDVSSHGNLTKLAKQTSLFPKNVQVKGQYDCYVNVASSLTDLKSRYRFPKRLVGSDSRIILPPVFGAVDLKDFQFINDSIAIAVNNSSVEFDGNQSSAKIKADRLKFNDNRKKTSLKNLSAKTIQTNINGKRLSVSTNIGELAVENREGEKFQKILSHKIDLTFDPNSNNLAGGTIEELSVGSDSLSVFGAKINLRFNRKKDSPSSSRQKKSQGTAVETNTLWDGGTARAYIIAVNGNDIDTYCKMASAEFKYGDSLSNLIATCDSIDLRFPGNELYTKNIRLKYTEGDNYSASVGQIRSRKLDYRIPLSIHSLNLSYAKRSGKINLQPAKVRIGESDITVGADISLLKTEKPKCLINASISGEYFNLTELLLANNKHALASGNPYAVPLDSIPEGGIPRMVPNGKNRMTLNINVNRMKLSMLYLNNVAGTIRVSDNYSLIDNLISRKDDNELRITTLLRYFDPEHSITNIGLESKKIDMSTLREIMPSISSVSPMLSALKGTVNFSICLQNPVRKVVAMDIKKVKGVAALQAQQLSIEDNEDFSNIAKKFMFKNREHTNIDSLAVAAILDSGQVRILPFMLKVDRYKVAVGGDNNMNTHDIDYHISILKSPIPFQFGVNVVGSHSPYKIKIMKTMYKHLDPSIKPWTDSMFVNFRNQITEPITTAKGNSSR